MKKFTVQLLICAAIFGVFSLSSETEDSKTAYYVDSVKAYITEDVTMGDIKDGAVTAISMAVEKPKEIYASVVGVADTNEFVVPVDEALVAVFNSGEKSDDYKYMSDDVIIVYASSGGMVENVTYDSVNQKYTVVIRHDDGIATKYKGCTKVYIGEKDRITKGQLIGEVDNEGIKDLTFEMWRDGEKISPGEYIK